MKQVLFLRHQMDEPEDEGQRQESGKNQEKIGAQIPPYPMLLCLLPFEPDFFWCRPCLVFSSSVTPYSRWFRDSDAEAGGRDEDAEVIFGGDPDHGRCSGSRWRCLDILVIASTCVSSAETFFTFCQSWPADVYFSHLGQSLSLYKSLTFSWSNTQTALLVKAILTFHRLLIPVLDLHYLPLTCRFLAFGVSVAGWSSFLDLIYWYFCKNIWILQFSRKDSGVTLKPILAF